MIKITLPDGSKKEFEKKVTVYEVALSIGAGLAKAALAARVDGELVDTSYSIESDANISIITERDPEGLGLLRHSCAHLLAHAVKLLHPDVQVTIGPVIDDGFYYDFAYDHGFTPEDLESIEAKMKELVRQDIPIERKEIARDEAISFFKGIGENYKIKIIQDIPEGETLAFYKQGEFIDLCRGPHLPSTGKIKVFKLMKVAGAYWRGDSQNEMLQRIYGTAWTNKKDLETYLHRLEEAEKRDHRKIAKRLNLFHLQEEAPGMVFWHNNGWIIYQVIEQYVRKKLQKHGYQEVSTPQIAARSLWESSGHWEKFGKEMFTTHSEHNDFAIKPMNCPCHVLIFNQGLHSYRDLPLRMAEFGSCHRNEPSGALHGLMRVRHFVQDDAHIFCTEEQVQDEVSQLIDLLYDIYHDFGFDDIVVRLSTRPEERIGKDSIWDMSEKILEKVLDEKGVSFTLCPGEGAFYGPKIEFSLQDCIGRVWQCGTIQLDFAIPERLDAKYVAEDGSRQAPIMIHRAILGSIERFIGILIEHYSGHFPVWLSPCQVVVMNITDKQAAYAEEITNSLNELDVRVKSDLRNEKIGFKIREHTIKSVPYLLIVGDKELDSQCVTVRKRSGEDLGQMSLDDFCKLLFRQEDSLGRLETNKEG